MHSHTRLYAAAAIILAIIVASFALSVPRTKDVAVRKAAEPASGVPPVTVRDSFRRGTHTISGTVEAPNACTAVSATATLEGDADNTARILLAISMPEDSGICLQVPTHIPFEASVAAPSNVPITVHINGQPATTTTP